MNQTLFVNSASIEYFRGSGSLVGSATTATSSSFASQSLWSTTSSYASNSVWAVSASVASSSLTASFLPIGTYQITASQAVTASFATSASWAPSGASGTTLFTASTYQITASSAVSSSYAVSSSFSIPKGAIIKAGRVSGSAFAGDPSTFSVAFTTTFASDLYSVTVTGTDAKTWLVENQAVGGFDICSNSRYKPSGSVYWQAVLVGEWVV